MSVSLLVCESQLKLWTTEGELCKVNQGDLLLAIAQRIA